MYDAIVLGLGGVGSMALRGLARQGQGGKFLGIEGYKLLHTMGSSHGKTRIYRRAYFEHPSYVPWIEESLRVFREMEVEHQASFMQECGTLIIEQCDHPTSKDPRYLPDYCRSSYESAVQHGIPVEHLDAATLKERFPQYKLGHRNDMVGMLEPSGGFVRCDHVMAAAQAEAQAASNVDILEETRALSLNYVASDDVKPTIELRIQTRDEELVVVATKCLLVSMGAWTGQLFPSWAPHLRPLRQFQGFVQVEQEQEIFGYQHLPTWVMVTPDYPTPLFGLPCDLDDPNGCEHWLKLGIHGRNDYIADPNTNPQEVSAAERKEVMEAVGQAIDLTRIKSADPCPDTIFADIKPCFYTMTTDEHFMLGTPAGHDNVFCVAGLSGHGYKQTPALGQMMVDYALGNDMTRFDFQFCDPQRFGV